MAITPDRPLLGRRRGFDRDVALTKALKLFWLHGYAPATIAQLCAAMEINPPSLYAAFGNKAKLFMEAVHYYEATYWDAHWEAMATEPDVHAAFETFFQQASAILTSQDAPCGCMVILGAANVAPDAQAINDALKLLREEGRDWFLTRLKQGIRDGQIPPKTNVEALASTLNTLLEGMSVQGRDGASRIELAQIGSTAMLLIPRHKKRSLRLR